MLTEFQLTVFSVLSRVPRGKVTTYGEIARFLGSSPRAVGQALRCNPFAPRVPCHRVVANKGALGGFGGKTSGRKLREKINLLKSEGLEIKKNTIVEFESVFFALK